MKIVDKTKYIVFNIYGTLTQGGISMARKSKDTIIKELQHYCSLNEMYISQLSARLAQLVDTIDDDFKHSPTYYFQQEKLNFINKLYNLNNSLYDSQKKQNKRLKDRLHSALQQLKQFKMAENECSDFLLSELQDQIRFMEGKIENRDETIQILNDEISGYQQTVAELQYAIAIQPLSDDIKELKTLLLDQSAATAQYRKQTKRLLLTHTMLITQLQELLEQPTLTTLQLQEAVKKILESSSVSDPTESMPTNPSNLEELQQLKDRIATLENELNELNAEKARYGRPPKVSSDDVAQIISCIKEGISYRKISQTYGYSLGTISRAYQHYKNQLQ